MKKKIISIATLIVAIVVMVTSITAYEQWWETSPRRLESDEFKYHIKELFRDEYVLKYFKESTKEYPFNFDKVEVSIMGILDIEYEKNGRKRKFKNVVMVHILSQYAPGYDSPTWEYWNWQIGSKWFYETVETYHFYYKGHLYAIYDYYLLEKEGIYISDKSVDEIYERL